MKTQKLYLLLLLSLTSVLGCWSGTLPPDMAAQQPTAHLNPSANQQSVTTRKVPVPQQIQSNQMQTAKFRPPAFEVIEADHLLCISVDVSGSFLDQIKRDGRAYKTLMAVVEKFTRETAGSQSRLIITQLSGGGSPLLWEGEPRDLRSEFANAGAFHAWLLSTQTAGGSHIYKGLAESIQYMLNHETMRNPQCRPALIVLSDLDDTTEWSTRRQYSADFARGLTELANRRGVVGMYQIAQQQNVNWARQVLADSGITEAQVSSIIVARPVLPSFH